MIPTHNNLVSRAGLTGLFPLVPTRPTARSRGFERPARPIRPWRVSPRPIDRRQLVCTLPGRTLFAAGGRAGVAALKREGDGATPLGRHAPIALLWRADRLRPPCVPLPARPIGPADGWSDDPADWRYNRRVPVPPTAAAAHAGRPDTSRAGHASHAGTPAPDTGAARDAAAPCGPPPPRFGHERLVRADGLYDVVLVTDHNQWPRVRGAGSAVFVHVARPDLSPTAGCIAFPAPDWRRLAATIAGRPLAVATPPRPLRRRTPVRGGGRLRTARRPPM